MVLDQKPSRLQESWVLACPALPTCGGGCFPGQVTSSLPSSRIQFKEAGRGGPTRLPLRSESYYSRNPSLQSAPSSSAAQTGAMRVRRDFAQEMPTRAAAQNTERAPRTWIPSLPPCPLILLRLMPKAPAPRRLRARIDPSSSTSREKEEGAQKSQVSSQGSGA